MDALPQFIAALSEWFGAPLRQWLSELDWARVLVGIGLVLVVLALRKMLARATIRAAIFIGEAIGVRINESIQVAVTPTTQALIVSLACLMGLHIVQLPEAIADLAEKILISIAIAALFAALYAMSDSLAELLEPYRTSRTAIQVDWVVRLARIAVVVLGGAAVLKVWSIDIGPVLTGMGLAGAAVALAAQDLFKNLIAGVTNMSEKRFQVGEWIHVEGIVEGTVEKVEFRSTLIRRFDLAPVYVPNADLSNTAVTNFSRMPYRRIYWKIGVLHATTTDQLRQICNGIEAYIDQSDDFVGPPEASRFVHVDSFGESSIDILVYCFTRSPARADHLAAKERLALKIKDVLAAAGSRFAYPSRSIYLEAAPEAPPDTFVPKPITDAAEKAQTKS